MSRLIFEGDTTERFGKLLPKPFIEKIRIFDNEITADIALYFQTEEGVTDSEFLSNNNLNGLKIYVGPHVDTRRDRPTTESTKPFGSIGNIISLLNDPTDSFFYQNPLSISNGGLNMVADIDNFDHTFFYNSDGERFIKFFNTISATKNEEHYELFFRKARGEISYLLSYTFFEDLFEEVSNYYNNLGPHLKKNEPFFEIIKQAYMNDKIAFNLMKSQISELSYEKVTNADGTLNVDRQQVYIEANGNYYNKTPLMSIDRVYRKTNLIDHTQVASTMQPIIQPYVGSIAEADLISSTLHTNMSDPRLLIKLQRNINNFSNKSSATTIGTLYGQLVDEISNVDSILTTSEKVEKRLEINSKIVDLRGDISFISKDTKLNFSNIQAAAYGAEPFKFVYPTMLTNQKVGFYDGTPDQKHYDDTITESILQTLQYDNQCWVYYTNGYSFFDFEKAINFDSNISEFFNPYNIFQLFGSGSLNKYFKVKEVNLLKRYTEYDDRHNLDFVNDILQARMDVENNEISIQRRGLPQLIQASRFEVSQVGATRETRQTYDIKNVKEQTKIRRIKFEPLAIEFDQIYYRIFTINFEDYDLIPSMSKIRYRFIYTVEDTTMQFFLYLKQLIFSEFERFEQYYNLASDFCSYNNIDNAFNDFFIESIEGYGFSEKKDLFAEQFPWQTGPYAYYMLEALIQTSYQTEVRSGNYADYNRLKDGSLIDIDNLKNRIKLEMQYISPLGGTLENVEIFYNKMKEMKDLFEKGKGFDWPGGRIYDETGILNEYSLLNPSEIKHYDDVKEIDRSTNVFTQIDLENLPDDFFD